MLLHLLRSYSAPTRARAPGRTAPPPCSTGAPGLRGLWGWHSEGSGVPASGARHRPGGRTPRSLLPPGAQRRARPGSRHRRRHPAARPQPGPGHRPPLPARPRSGCQLPLRMPRRPAPGLGRGTRAAGVRGGSTGQEGTGRSALARAAERIPARMRCGAGAGRGRYSGSAPALAVLTPSSWTSRE